MQDWMVSMLAGLCHQLPEHALQVAGQPMPLCARCAGMHLTAALALLLANLVPRLRRANLPSGREPWVLAVLTMLWALDGANSTAMALFGRALYPPHNLLRLLTGTGVGLVISALLGPLFADVVLGTESSSNRGAWPKVITPVGATALASILLLTDCASLIGITLLLFLSAVVVLGASNAVLLGVIRRERGRPRWSVAIVSGGGVAMAIAEMWMMSLLLSALG